MVPCLSRLFLVFYLLWKVNLLRKEEIGIFAVKITGTENTKSQKDAGHHNMTTKDAVLSEMS